MSSVSSLFDRTCQSLEMPRSIFPNGQNQLVPKPSPLLDDVSFIEEGLGNESASGDDERAKHEMSGLSLAMMGQGANDCTEEHNMMMMKAPNTPTAHEYSDCSGQDYYGQGEDDFCILSASPDTQTAFHDPPPQEGTSYVLQQSPFSPMATPTNISTAKADVSLGDDFVSVAQSPPALPSLLRRCSEETSPKLKMFHRKQGLEGIDEAGSIQDQLSDFKSFGVSL